MFGQQFALHDVPVVGLLILLEGILSIDNALVLGLLARRVPKHLQRKALTYGLVGAFVFRFIAIAVASFLLHWTWAKLLGGAYLVYVAVNHFFFEKQDAHQAGIRVGPDGQPVLDDADQPSALSTSIRSLGAYAKIFWSAVLVIEMTDIAFAIDSIVAAMGVIPPSALQPHPKLWVVITGGFLGVVMMRFAAILFIRLLERFPRFEVSAYLLVTVIGVKLVADWAFNTEAHPHRLDFHSPKAWAFWLFWGLMAGCFVFGFSHGRHKTISEKELATSHASGRSPQAL